jgi:hypothetical protein
MHDRFKTGAILTLIAFIIGFFVWSNQRDTAVFPEEGTVTYEQLDEIIELAEDRTRHYGLILDDIEDKVNEIKQNMRDEWELQHDINKEKENEHHADQLW